MPNHKYDAINIHVINKRLHCLAGLSCHVSCSVAMHILTVLANPTVTSNEILSTPCKIFKFLFMLG